MKITKGRKLEEEKKPREKLFLAKKKYDKLGPVIIFGTL